MTPPGWPPSWVEQDSDRLWHPYASATYPPTNFRVTNARGVRLTLDTPDGHTIEAIDAMSSWWCAIHGYRHPHLDRAIHAQVDQFSHVMFGGLTHDPAIEVAGRLRELTGMDRVFLADSGSVSVEVALKLAIQAQAGREGRLRRTQFMTIRGGYHGDTTGAMSVCDPVGGMHSLFRGVLAPQVFAPAPPPWRDCWLSATDDDATHERALAEWSEQFRQIASDHAEQLAAVIVEPVLQGAGGMRPYDPRALVVMREVCDELGLLLILDEIATGFGRTGVPFGVDHTASPVRADIVCVGKALTGGYLSLAATLCTTEVAELVSSPAGGGALMHGPTFMGNPLACSVANASLDLLDASSARVGRIEAGLRAGLATAVESPGVAEVRVLGAVGVIVLEAPAPADVATRAALDEGVWIRPFGRLLYTMPPYLVGNDEVTTVCSALIAAAEASSMAGEMKMP